MQLHLFEATEAPHHEVFCFDEEDDNMDLLPWLATVIKMEEDHQPTSIEFQVIELEVERPYLVLSSGISYIFEFSSSCSQVSVASFFSLDSFKSFKSFSSFFFPFLPNMKKKIKFDLSSSL